MGASAIPDATTLEFSAHGAGHWQVAFVQWADRFTHRLVWLPDPTQHGQAPQDRVSTPLVSAWEGTSDEDWPASPVLQQVHACPLPQGRQGILGVGMAGRSHWSIAVETLPDRPGVSMDVACRVQAQPQSLGSTYRLPPGTLATEMQPDKWVIDAGAHQLLLSIDMPMTVRFDAATSALRLRPDQKRLDLKRREDFPQTIRWKYCFQAFQAG